jgi:hypothetical protein
MNPSDLQYQSQSHYLNFLTGVTDKLLGMSSYPPLRAYQNENNNNMKQALSPLSLAFLNEGMLSMNELLKTSTIVSSKPTLEEKQLNKDIARAEFAKTLSELTLNKLYAERELDEAKKELKLDLVRIVRLRNEVINYKSALERANDFASELDLE